MHVERDSDGNGAAITSAVDALSMRGTKEFAGYEHGSTTSERPWWSAEARNTWITSAGDMPEGSEAYLFCGASVEGAACELRVLAPKASVEVGVQSWLEQRMKTKTRRKPQPYR